MRPGKLFSPLGCIPMVCSLTNKPHVSTRLERGRGALAGAAVARAVTARPERRQANIEPNQERTSVCFIADSLRCRPTRRVGYSLAHPEVGDEAIRKALADLAVRDNTARKGDDGRRPEAIREIPVESRAKKFGVEDIVCFHGYITMGSFASRAIRKAMDSPRPTARKPSWRELHKKARQMADDRIAGADK